MRSSKGCEDEPLLIEAKVVRDDVREHANSQGLLPTVLVRKMEEESVEYEEER